MKANVLVALFCAAAFITSCDTVEKSSRTLSVSTSVTQYPTVADLSVQAKAGKAVEWKHILFNFGQPSLETRKSNLMADLLKETGADVLLEPQFVYTKSLLGQCSLMVTGYPATFSHFRRATPEDLEALREDCPAHKRKVYNVARPWHKLIRKPHKK